MGAWFRALNLTITSRGAASGWRWAARARARSCAVGVSEDVVGSRQMWSTRHGACVGHGRKAGRVVVSAAVSAQPYGAVDLGAGVVDMRVHGGSADGRDQRVVQSPHEVGDVAEGALHRCGRRQVGEELGDEPFGGVACEGGVPVGVEAVVDVVLEPPRPLVTGGVP